MSTNRAVAGTIRAEPHSRASTASRGRNADDAHVRLDGRERVVRRQRACPGQRVEQGRLADVGQADDADGQAHPGESNWAPAPVRPAWPPASVTPRCNDRYMSVISLLAVLIGIAIGAVLGSSSPAAGRRAPPPAWPRGERGGGTGARRRRSGPPWSRASSPSGSSRCRRRRSTPAPGGSWRWPRTAGRRHAKAAGELETRRAAVENLVGPLKETLARVESQLRDSTRNGSGPCRAGRAGAHRAPELGAAQDRDPGAGHRPTPAGGPRPLGRDAARRVVELAGMSSRCRLR